jgi:hypothetical protein
LGGVRTRRRDAASTFTIRNSHRARKRGWITASTIAAGAFRQHRANAPRKFVFRWRCYDDDKRDAEAAEAERLLDEGKTVVAIGWGRRRQDHRTPSQPRAFEQVLRSWRRPDKAGNSPDFCRSTTGWRAQ